MNNAFNPAHIKQLFLDKVWHTAEAQFSANQARLVTILRITHLVIRDLLEGMVTLRAMGLVYTTILALVPLLAVSFSVLKGFGVHNQIEPLLLNLFLPLGDKGVELAAVIIKFVDNTRAGILGSLGLILLMYTVVSLLQKIEQSFNYTWRVSQHRSIGQRFSNYITVVLVGPVLLFTALGISASVSNVSFIQDAMQIESIGVVAKFFGTLIPMLLVTLTFTFVYIFVPNTKVHFTSAFIGAVVAAVLWDISSWAFSSFVVGSAKYTAIYSAFASAIIFFIWLYINWLILLIGCTIVFYHQNPSQRNLASQRATLSNRLKESIALNVMVLVGKHYHAHKTPWSICELAEKMNINEDLCSTVVNHLCARQLLKETADLPPAYLPAYDMDTLSLYDIMTAIRAAEESDTLSIQTINAEADVLAIEQIIEDALAEKLKGQSLKDLASKD